MTEADTIPKLFGTTDALAEVCRRFHVQQLYLFGSAATGRGYDPARSAIDVLVSCRDLGSFGYANAWFGLHDALQKLSGRPVDLIAEAAIKNPYLRRRVDAERQLLFEAQ